MKCRTRTITSAVNPANVEMFCSRNRNILEAEQITRTNTHEQLVYL
jgi:hypothetical protein